MKIDGSCYCGAITYAAEVDPDGVVICHCTDCQTLSGSAFRTIVRARAGSFRMLTGYAHTYVKTAESGRPRQQGFCPACGTPIYSTSVGEGPKVYSIRVGTVRQRAQLVPKAQIWTRSALPWLGEMPKMRRVEKDA